MGIARNTLRGHLRSLYRQTQAADRREPASMFAAPDRRPAPADDRA